MSKALTKVDPPVMRLNNDEDVIASQVQRNIRRWLPQLQPYKKRDTTALLIGGGPSLEGMEDDIRNKQADGAHVVAMNYTHDWLIERDIMPGAMVMVDTREHNARFVKNARGSCAYFIASQCHPKVFDLLDGKTVVIWHPACTIACKDVLDFYYMGKWYHVIGGSTVMIRSLVIMQLLGFSNFEIYGFDSCLIGGEHHAYEQVENENDHVFTLVCGERTFQVTAWMYAQADDFITSIKTIGQNIKMIVHGDGLISHIIKTGAKLPKEK